MNVVSSKQVRLCCLTSTAVVVDVAGAAAFVVVVRNSQAVLYSTGTDDEDDLDSVTVSEKLRTFCVLVQEQISTILEGSSVFIQPPQCCTQSVNCASFLPVCSQSSIHCESCCVQFSVSSSVLLLFTELLLKLALFF